ncbi:MAG: hypothetical protein LBV44_02725, partial [Methylobacillus sp.]|nr:hypothetical protein [Methylobacillus sp.]
DVASLDEIKARTLAAIHGKPAETPRHTFLTYEHLLRTITPGHLGLLEALAGAGPLGVRELSRRVQRDVKGVHTDAQALVKARLIEKKSDGKLLFPYDEVDVHFAVKVAKVA